MLLDFLSLGDAVESSLDFWVGTVTWHWVVDWVTFWCLWPLVLSASSGGADWVTLGLGGELHVHAAIGISVGLGVEWLWHGPESVLVLSWGPVVVEGVLSSGDGGLSSFDVFIDTEVWHFIVNIMTLWLFSWSPDVVQLLLSSCDSGVTGHNGISISTEVWHKVIHWVSFNLWVLILSAASGRADWVTLDLDSVHGSDDGNCNNLHF